MAALTRNQKNVLRRALKVADRKGASPRERKALVQALSVESNFRDLPYGDRDSVGALQQRPSQGWGPASESLEKDVSQFLQRAKQANTGKGSAGQLAQSVQRSAFPERYDQANVGGLLKKYGTGSPSVSSSSSVRTQSTPVYETRPAVSREEDRKALKLQYLSERGKPGALLGLKQGLDEAQDIPAEKVQVGTNTTKTKTVTQTKAKSTANPSAVDDILAEAELINSAKTPYLWGGGHQKKLIRGSKVTPLDCSGAVSRALGINPRVSGQFESWGRSGKGKRVTIYANEGHVLMEINGHFWGTSKSNPGGGPGWIPRKQISKEYLSKFTARHPPGM